MYSKSLPVRISSDPCKWEIVVLMILGDNSGIRKKVSMMCIIIERKRWPAKQWE
jgi:hypothetical protein